jgi:hypothetical protein
MAAVAATRARLLPWLALLAWSLCGCGCGGSARRGLEHGERLLAEGRGAEACAVFDQVAARTRNAAADRVTALTRAALVADQLGDQRGAQARLEQAVQLDAPGVVEPALYYLAERLRSSDRARSLNLYYRAAAGAEKYRARGFPYREATDRILELSTKP